MERQQLIRGHRQHPSRQETLVHFAEHGLNSSISWMTGQGHVQRFPKGEVQDAQQPKESSRRPCHPGSEVPERPFGGQAEVLALQVAGQAQQGSGGQGVATGDGVIEAWFLPYDQVRPACLGAEETPCDGVLEALQQFFPEHLRPAHPVGIEVSLEQVQEALHQGRMILEEALRMRPTLAPYAQQPSIPPEFPLQERRAGLGRLQIPVVA